jgi:hypothetical protein
MLVDALVPFCDSQGIVSTRCVGRGQVIECDDAAADRYGAKRSRRIWKGWKE